MLNLPVVLKLSKKAGLGNQIASSKSCGKVDGPKKRISEYTSKGLKSQRDKGGNIFPGFQRFVLHPLMMNSARLQTREVVYGSVA